MRDSKDMFAAGKPLPSRWPESTEEEQAPTTRV